LLHTRDAIRDTQLRMRALQYDCRRRCWHCRRR
jgi:hypothetical protein